MEEVRITRHGVKTLLNKIQPNKVGGPDKIAARFVKETASELSGVVAFIYQESYDTGHVPKDWRLAYVSPVFKKGKKCDPANYRPISLTCILCKGMEHVMVSSMMDHLDAHDALANYQHGFRHNRSCESQLLVTTNDIASALDRRQQTDMAVLDFSKAFDKVPHQRLLYKLQHYGVSGKNLDWIRGFLSNRHQSVVVDGAMSSLSEVSSGVPQGSVMGPILFLIYINDIGWSVNSTVKLFADDCLVYRTIRSAEDTLTLQHDLNTLDDWATKWQMAFNVKKCQMIRITNARRNIFPGDYFMGDEMVQWTDSAPYLGVLMTKTSMYPQQVPKPATPWGS